MQHGLRLVGTKAGSPCDEGQRVHSRSLGGRPKAKSGPIGLFARVSAPGGIRLIGRGRQVPEVRDFMCGIERTGIGLVEYT